MNHQHNKTWLCMEWPTLKYADARNVQTQWVSAIGNGSMDTNVILMLEHPPVFTQGRRGGLKNLTVSENFLKDANMAVIHTERGGDMTFHGPGQLIVYPIINLRAAKMAVTDYVENLEEVMIRTARQWGIRASRKPINRGVWVGNNKLGSIGIAIRHGISFHGLALNVNCALEPFGWIHPCGLRGVGVTSFKQEIASAVSMRQIRKAVKHHFQTVFDVKLVMANMGALNKKGL